MMKSLSRVLLAVVALGFLTSRASAQDSRPMTLRDAINGYESVTNGHAGLPEDWSTHHLIFSRPVPGTAAYDKVTHDPRYWMHQIKRSSGAKPVVDAGIDFPNPVNRKSGVKKDWTETLIADGQVQPNMYPAKFGFYPTAASCANDFVVYPTGVPGAAGAANIIAYYELYGTNTPTQTGCGSASVTVPSVHWAYNTGGMVTTSPIVSNDTTGSQVAFIQVSGTTASLVVLKWAASTTETLTSPHTLTATAASSYRGCTAPCFTSLSLSANDTYSSPYYDFISDDALYVGDDSGELHKITGVFNGTPTLDPTGFPATLNASDKTTSPVYDASSGYVFAGNTGAIFYAVGSGNAGTTAGKINGTSSALGGTGAAIIDAPIVDSSAGKVYAFVSNDSSGDNGVFQFATSFTTGAGTEEKVGTGAAQAWRFTPARSTTCTRARRMAAQATFGYLETPAWTSACPCTGYPSAPVAL